MTINLNGNTNGVYIDPSSGNAYLNHEQAENYAEVNMDGVNHLCMTRFYKPSRGYVTRIVQASGYTQDRGMFIDCY